ncbi:MAG TPA: CBS domain-containing protein [Gaiellaceae bacterium]|jgi:CBS domain-containing protein|nr:CBS domain-containing protein [Gaiellaceae bacterium]
MTKKVQQVMTSQPQSVRRTTTVRSAAEIMEREDVGSLPVVEDGGVLMGIVTDRDIVVRVVAAGRNVDEVSVGEILTEHPVLVFPDESLDHAMELMAKHQIRRLPVVYDTQLVGMLTQADIAQEAKDKQAGHVLEAISQHE